MASSTFRGLCLLLETSGVKVRANGDDIVAESMGLSVERMRSYYLERGKLLKDVFVDREWVEFCSHRFNLSTGQVVFCNFAKALATVLSKKRREQGDWDVLFTTVRLCPEFPAFCDLFERLVSGGAPLGVFYHMAELTGGLASQT